MRVQHAIGAYDVRVTSMAEGMAAIPEDAVIVTDENVFRHWGPAFPQGRACSVLPPGEQTKSLESYESLLHWCAQQGVSRRTTLVSIGGGVIGDLAGFVAATYMRGIPLIQVPTTLLAQVDSAVGGKVGIDMPEGKNLVGAFYQPQGVLVPLDALDTLDPRHFRNGLAEVVKYGFILDVGLLDQLQAGIEPGSQALPDIIGRCIALKAKVVQEDEKEESGRRAILNFGHTIGHAIEQVTGFGPVLHGEAIAVGMVVEAKLGEMLGITSRGVTQAVRVCLAAQGLRTAHDATKDTAAILAATRLDKKARCGNLAFSLLVEPGECKLVEDVPSDLVEAALKEC